MKSPKDAQHNVNVVVEAMRDEKVSERKGGRILAAIKEWRECCALEEREAETRHKRARTRWKEKERKLLDIIAEQGGNTP